MAVADSSSARLTTSRRGVVHRARLLHLVGDHLVALVEEQDAELLLLSNPMEARQ
jgi:hypothetical protein